jgi:hypothetical protein
MWFKEYLKCYLASRNLLDRKSKLVYWEEYEMIILYSLRP